jgi:hypothetical protein
MKTGHLFHALSSALLLFLLAAPPALARPAARVDPTFRAWLMSAPPARLCPGDQAALSVFIMDTSRNLPAAGYPVNILQSDPAVGVLDPVSKVITNGTVNFVYKSNENGSGKGTQKDVLTFTIGGYPTGLKVPVTVEDCGDYQFDFLLEQTKKADAFELYTYFSGKSTAARLNGQLTGTETGVDEAFVSVFGATNGMVCALEPPIQGSGVFNTDGVIQPQAPGIDLLTVHFTFESVAYNSGEMACTVAGVRGAYPFEPGNWDPDELGLTELAVTLQNGSGTIPISAKGLTGQLTVRRGK